MILRNSKQCDLAHLVSIAHVLFCLFSCRVWFEWIDSSANPSDGLSREGEEDEMAARLGWNPQSVEPPPWDVLRDTPLERLGSLGGIGAV